MSFSFLVQPSQEVPGLCWVPSTLALSVESSLLVILNTIAFWSTSDNSPNDSFNSNHNWKIQETKPLARLFEKKNLFILRWLISTCQKKKYVQPALNFDEIIISSYRNQITGRLKATWNYKGQLFHRTGEKIRQRKIRYLHQFEVSLTRTWMFWLSIYTFYIFLLNPQGKNALMLSFITIVERIFYSQTEIQQPDPTFINTIATHIF